MLCKECFFYDFQDKSCVARYNMPTEEEKCYFFEEQVEVSLNQIELWAIMDMFIQEEEGLENKALRSFCNKIKMIISMPHKAFDTSTSLKGISYESKY